MEVKTDFSLYQKLPRRMFWPRDFPLLASIEGRAQSAMIEDLVGLKWQDNELDCVKLMIKAQRELWGRNICASKNTIFKRRYKRSVEEYHR
jgi:hypothetical protein